MFSKLPIILQIQILNHCHYWLSILTYRRSLKSSFNPQINCETCSMSQYKILSRGFSRSFKLFFIELFTLEFHYMKLFQVNSCMLQLFICVIYVLLIEPMGTVLHSSREYNLSPIQGQHHYFRVLGGHHIISNTVLRLYLCKYHTEWAVLWTIQYTGRLQHVNYHSEMLKH